MEGNNYTTLSLLTNLLFPLTHATAEFLFATESRPTLGQYRFLCYKHWGLWPLRWVRNVIRMEDMRNTYKILVGKSEGKSSLGRPRHRWDVTIYHTERGWEGVDCIHLAQDLFQWRVLVNTVTNLESRTKRRVNSSLVEPLLASQECLCSVEFLPHT
jgi:hypothetical protein